MSRSWYLLLVVVVPWNRWWYIGQLCFTGVSILSLLACLPLGHTKILGHFLSILGVEKKLFIRIIGILVLSMYFVRIAVVS